MFAYGETVIFTEAGARTDPYSGESVKDDWGNPTVTLMVSAGVAPGGSVEPAQDGRAPVGVELDLLLDGFHEIDPSWKAEVRGVLYNVIGRPFPFRNPFTGWEPGTVAQVGRTDG